MDRKRQSYQQRLIAYELEKRKINNDHKLSQEEKEEAIRQLANRLKI